MTTPEQIVLKYFPEATSEIINSLLMDLGDLFDGNEVNINEIENVLGEDGHGWTA